MAACDGMLTAIARDLGQTTLQTRISVIVGENAAMVFFLPSIA
jgi:hypothetical protein